ncbi:Uncharacterised protein [uncultured archaeon]|nr:Uncharacterised protein [uncultured archaeon]
MGDNDKGICTFEIAIDNALLGKRENGVFHPEVIHNLPDAKKRAKEVYGTYEKQTFHGGPVGVIVRVLDCPQVLNSFDEAEKVCDVVFTERDTRF